MLHRENKFLLACGLLLSSNWIAFSAFGQSDRFLSERFTLGLRLEPIELRRHTLLGSIPITSVAPEQFSMSRLESLGAEQVVIWAAPIRNENSQATVQWAVAVKLQASNDLDRLLQLWNARFPFPDKQIQKTAVDIAGHRCIRVKSGTVLPVWNRPLEISFSDRDGKSTRDGISVGNLDSKRGFAEGATQSSIVYQLDDIDSSRLQNNSLVLDFRAETFLTKQLPNVYAMATVELRNPATGLTTKPSRIEVVSHADSEITFGPQVEVQQEGMDTADLLRDIVNDGRVEVIFRCLDSATYLGMRANDLRVRTQRFEYIFLDEELLIVSESMKTMKELLGKRAAVWAALQTSNEGELTFTTRVRNEADREVLTTVVELLGNTKWLRHWSQNSVDTVLGIAIADSSVKGNVEYKSAEMSSQGLELLSAAWAETEPVLFESLENGIRQLDARSSLIESISSWRFSWPPGIPASFPERTSLSSHSRIEEMQQAVSEAIEKSSWEVAENRLKLELHWPPPRDLDSVPLQTTLSNLDQAYAVHRRESRNFDASMDCWQRAVDRFPDSHQLRFMRAYEFAYNTSRQFESPAVRYRWIRKSILSLLEAADRNIQDADYIAMAAFIISRRLGLFDETNSEMQTLFSQDAELTDALDYWLVSNTAKNPKRKLDCWLVSLALLDFAEGARGPDSQWPDHFFRVERLFLKVEYAISMNKHGHWKQAESSWREALQLCRDLCNDGLELGDSGRIRFANRPSAARMAPRLGFGTGGTQKETITELYRLSLLRCEFELRPEVQRARRLQFHGLRRELRDETTAAFLLEETLMSLAESRSNDADLVDLFLPTFQDAADRYKRLTAVKVDIPMSVAAILTKMEAQRSLESIR